MPNMIAYGALLLWPLVSLALYMMLPAGRATIWTVLAGYLILPVGLSFDFPGVPPMDKGIIPNLCALILAPLMARRGEFRWPRSVTVNVLLLVLVLSPFATALTNGDPISIGPLNLPGLGFREGLASAVGTALQAVPFVLGAALLGSERGHRDVLIALVLAALVYSLPMLAEIRLSPFLQARLYGISQEGAFAQQVRGSGFRSMMFLGHGLLVSTFIAMALLAAIGLARMRARPLGLPMVAVAVYLAVLLLLNKSLGPAIFAIMLGLPLLFMQQRRALTLALGIALLLVTYPAVRAANVLPLGAVADAISMVSAERAESFEFRLRNEDILLARAEQRPLFGWGSFGRNRVIVATNYGTASDSSVTDGTWVIAMGASGWAGYIALFGLLTYPFWRAFRLRRSHVSIATVTLLATHLLNVIDLIPNSSLRPITWLIAGSLAGMVAMRQVAASNGATSPGRRQPARVRAPALQA